MREDKPLLCEEEGCPLVLKDEHNGGIILPCVGDKSRGEAAGERRGEVFRTAKIAGCEEFCGWISGGDICCIVSAYTRTL
ncbi:MAG: hypothetical protein BWY45_02979 [Euryarchaeota archaeon ADurb.Bin294]|nr:MAG: hypothetical protein BWY45_02979 [Euryarchaeota archaeon ADurb.Bin294]